MGTFLHIIAITRETALDLVFPIIENYKTNSSYKEEFETMHAARQTFVENQQIMIDFCKEIEKKPTADSFGNFFYYRWIQQFVNKEFHFPDSDKKLPRD